MTLCPPGYLDRSGHKAAWVVSLFALLAFLQLLALPQFQFLSHGAFLATHLTLELFAVIVSALVVIMAWSTLSSHYNPLSNILIFGFTVVAGCDLIHVLSYEGMPGLFRESDTETAIFFWLVGRSIETLTVGLIALPIALPLSKWVWQIAALLTVVFVCWLGFYHLDWFPATFVAGQGVTAFKVKFEYVLCAAHLLLAVWYWRTSLKENSPRAIWIAAACFVMGLGGLIFTLYVTPSDFSNLSGHVFKVVSYSLIFKATFLLSITEPLDLLKQSKQLLTDKQLELDSIMQHIHAGITRIATDLSIVYVNEVQASYLHRSRHELMGKSIAEVFVPLQLDALQEKVLLALSGQTVEAETRGLDLHGEPILYLLVSMAPEYSADGKIIGCVALMTDVTEKRLTDKKLIDSLAEISELTAALDEHAIVAVTDACGVITRVNDKFCAISQYLRSELIGSTHSIINSKYHSPDFFQNLWRTISRGEVWTGEICNRAKDGSLYWVYTTIVPFIGAEGIPVQYIAIRADITERKHMEQEAQHLAFFDVLTGLPNRRLLIDRLNQSLASSHRGEQYGSLIFLDLDNFKDVNDTLGHDKGDLLLQEVAHRLTRCVRQSDTVARFGGDEFVILLNGLGGDLKEAPLKAGSIAEKILHILNEDYQIDGNEVVCTPSMGITIFKGLDIKKEELLQQADMALYQAKGQGRNNMCFFDPRLQSNISESAAMGTQLRHAIANQELHLFYQPLVDETLRVTGVEALIRWMHPQRGLVSPVVFIPIAEKSNLILEIGLWVLKTACQQLAQWAHVADRSDWTIAVNVSARQFHHSDFVAQVVGMLKKAGANPERLKLEITESMLLTDLEETIEKMNLLRSFGVRFSLDDFGTGYSSLTYLKRLPLDQLKIDKSFVREIVTNANDAAIARTILSLALTLELGVVAEGVETEGQFDFLRSHGCKAFQGYLFGRPVPVDELVLPANLESEQIENTLGPHYV